MKEYQDIVFNYSRSGDVPERVFELSDLLREVSNSLEEIISCEPWDIPENRGKLKEDFYKARFILDVIHTRYGVCTDKWEPELLAVAKTFKPEESLDDLEF